MTDEVAAVPSPLGARVRHGLRRSGNWLQLLRFALVGASGYAVNLGVYATALHVAQTDFRVAAVLAWLVAVTNNFWWNRHWTFRAGSGHAGFQAARFFCVSLGAFAVNLVALELLVSAAGVAKVPAQALAVAIATPCNFLGNRLWTFARA